MAIAVNRTSERTSEMERVRNTVSVEYEDKW